MKSLQEEYAAKSICYGCGPANEKGLKVKSVVQGETVICEWQPEAHHHAFPGVLNGGIIGSILDCHSNWAAAWHLMEKNKLDQPPCTVTADYHVKLLRPTPMTEKVKMVAKILQSSEDRALVETELWSMGKITATCRGTFVAVKEGHPAYHRW